MFQNKLTTSIIKYKLFWKPQCTFSLTKNLHCDTKPLKWEDAKPFDQIPGPKPLPILGNSLLFFPGGKFYKLQIHELIEKLKEEYGDIAAVKGIPGQSDFYFLFNPDDIEHHLRNQGPVPRRNGLPSYKYYRTETRKDIFQGVTGLVSAIGGEEWSNYRSSVNPILMQPGIEALYIPSTDLITDDLLKIMQNFSEKNSLGEMPEDFINTLYKWAMESIGFIGLDRRLGCLRQDLPSDSDEQKFIDSIMKMMEYMYQLDLLPSLWKHISTPTWNKYVEVLDMMTNTILKYVDEAQKNLDKSHNQISVFHKLLKVDRIIALTMVMDMMIAGVETTSQTLGAALYFLAKNPEKQINLRKEVMELMPDKTTSVTKDILDKATYLKAVIKETTRIMPVGIGSQRTTVKDMVFSGYQVPEGTEVITCNILLTNSDKYFVRAKEFLPERWLRDLKDNDVSFKNVQPLIFIPFGFGPRSCIGKRLANLEIEIAILKIIRNFELSWPHKEMTFTSKLLYGMNDPLKLLIKPLSH